MVIDFTATWCGPCRWMDPTIDELAATFADVDFIKIDVDELMVRSPFLKTTCMMIAIKSGLACP